MTIDVLQVSYKYFMCLQYPEVSLGKGCEMIGEAVSRPLCKMEVYTV